MLPPRRRYHPRRHPQGFRTYQVGGKFEGGPRFWGSGFLGLRVSGFKGSGFGPLGGKGLRVSGFQIFRVRHAERFKRPLQAHQGLVTLGGFPKRFHIGGVPIIRIQIFWGLY